MSVIGGRAHINGVSFFSAHYISTSIIKEHKVYTSVRRRSKIDCLERLEKIPLLRGLIILIEAIVLAGKPFYILAATFGFFWFVELMLFLIGGETAVKQFSILSLDIPLYMLLLFLFATLLLIRFSPLTGFHAAEHKVFNTYEQGKKLNIENVRKASNISFRCGTNLVVFTFIIFFVLSYIKLFPISILFCISISIGYELFLLDHKRYGKFLLGFYLIGAVLQKYVVTKEPSDEQIQVAIEALEKIKDRGH